jgi:hypothetical protein
MRITTLAVLHQVDRRVPLWKDESLRRAVECAISDASARLEGSLRADGSWDESWSLPEFSRGVLNVENRLLVTGHLLEWQSITPPELRASSSVLQSAGEFVVREVERMSVERRHEKICATSHGLRALALGSLRRTDFNQPAALDRIKASCDEYCQNSDKTGICP